MTHTHSRSSVWLPLFLILLLAPTAKDVCVVGTFNDWQASSTPLKPGTGGVWNPTAGTYTITATAYSADNAAGTAGTSYTVTFKVIDSSVDICTWVGSKCSRCTACARNNSSLNGRSNRPRTCSTVQSWRSAGVMAGVRFR